MRVTGSRVSGTQAEIRIVQSAATGFRDELRVSPRGDFANMRQLLERKVAGWQERFAGTAVSVQEESGQQALQVEIPQDLRIPHEAQFAKLRDRFLELIDAPEWPARLAGEISQRYALLGQAGDAPSPAE